ncbi:flavin reductase family protein [Myxococcota bacterium]|nr:flavin reductase family protein [Myxococcota bacterium]MBU1429277.1 flavin reductase family protein [Myxococcota bacterium]MBU1898044.1 flavin reductase family protein [Myxococcota bacterium]
MQIDAQALSPKDAYFLLSELIIPRPIAWVTTLGEGVNLAPFSFFTGISAAPPTLCFSVARGRDGARKDTARNLAALGEFVVNVAPRALAAEMAASGAPYEYGVSELDALGLEALPSVKVKPPRVKGAPAQMECVLTQTVPILNDEGAVSAELFIGRVVYVHLDDALRDAQGRISAARLDPVGRLSGQLYCGVADPFELG